MSVSINVSHASLLCGEAWGTEPRFSWFHERVAVTDAVGRVSGDGTTLFVTRTPFCGHFTCVVSNKLGHSAASYTAGTSPHFISQQFFNNNNREYGVLRSGISRLVNLTIVWVYVHLGV